MPLSDTARLHSLFCRYITLQMVVLLLDARPWHHCVHYGAVSSLLDERTSGRIIIYF